MQKFNGSLIRQFPSLVTGNAAAGVQVTVYVSGTNTLATLYAADNISGATISNPLTTNGVGFYAFYAPDGKYRLVFSDTRYTPLEVQCLDAVQVVSEIGMGQGLVGQAASAALQSITSQQAEVEEAYDEAIVIINEAAENIPEALSLVGTGLTFNSDITTIPTGGLVAGNWATDLDTGEQFIWGFLGTTGYWWPMNPSYATVSHQALPERNGSSRHVASDIDTGSGNSLADLLLNFTIVTPPAGDAGAYINGLIASGIRNAFCAAGEWIFNTPVNVNSITLNLLGAGKTLTIFKRGPSLGTANFFTGSNHDLEFSRIGFDTGKGTYTPTLADFTQENAINSLSPKRLKVTACDFKNLVNLGAVVNGTALNEAKDVDISGNTGSNGTRGLAMVRRYGRNVHMDRNILHNIIDVPNTLFKPLEISGTFDGSMDWNSVTQDNGAGGQLIFEYIDRECRNVSMRHNSYYGGGDGQYKVGASTNVWFEHNYGDGGAGINAYFEGVETLWITANDLRDAGRNNLVIAQDEQTGRFCKNVKIFDNYLRNANMSNQTPGTPYGAIGSTDSYHVWVQEGTEDIELAGNHYIKGANIAGGLLISSLSYTIKGEDFSKLDDNAVTVHNGFAGAGARYEIIDCIGCATTDKGQVTIPSGSASALIEPNIVTVFDPHTLTTLQTALSGTVAYTYVEADAAPSVAVLCRNSSHASATASADIKLDWSVDVSKSAKGALGKTEV